ncbi:MAG: PEP-CTERM sorting domain-containing protein [Gammaproteobacteria bacterium]|nr:PEP-CTERM sorting domain-containing protein [Gammaproteobacteria bacterium]NNF60657.1 PEP-CTERM sorting domain-containing protein [Gammaproteobacteria bacterium]
MKKITLLASFLAILIPVGSHAVAIDAGSAYLDRENSSRIFQIDASGYADLSLSILALGGGTIDYCGRNVIGDCLDVSADGGAILSGLSITNTWQEYTAALPAGDSMVELAFDALISGSDESMTINWQVDAATQMRQPQDSRVLTVNEPGILLLIGLGLAAIGTSRRRQ